MTAKRQTEFLSDDKRKTNAVATDAVATNALEDARAMPPGPERTDALKKAGLLRQAVDSQGLVFAKRGRPRK
jgi:hypothetical protein